MALAFQAMAIAAVMLETPRPDTIAPETSAPESSGLVPADMGAVWLGGHSRAMVGRGTSTKPLTGHFPIAGAKPPTRSA